MTTPDAALDPASRHTEAARRAVERRDMGGFIRALIGWLSAVCEPWRRAI